MTEIRKDHDASAKAPEREAETSKTKAPGDKQDAKNYDGTKDGGKSLPVDDVNSANDE